MGKPGHLQGIGHRQGKEHGKNDYVIPVDVDRVKGKEKGKGKGKDKGGKSTEGERLCMAVMPTRTSRAKANNRKEKMAGKGNGLSQDTCKLCGGKGHWSRECPMRTLRQVSETASTVTARHQQAASR